MITLYGVKESRAIRCMWVLEELGLEYAHNPISPFTGETYASEEYMALNPMGKIPTLKDGDFVLFESMAINMYLAKKYPGSLWQDEPEALAKTLQWSLWASNEVEYYLTIIVREGRRPEGQIDESRVPEAKELMAKNVDVLEKYLSDNGPYLLGSEFSIADINTASVIMYLGMMGIEADKFPNMNKWLSSCLARQAWQKLQS